MEFFELLAVAKWLLERRRRISYRTLKRELRLDDETLENLRHELIVGTRLAHDDNGKALVWTDCAPAPGASAMAHSAEQSASASSTGAFANHAAPAAELRAAAYTESPGDVAAHPSPPASVPEAERRQLTVMFCDLMGSTALSTTLDPEDLREVIASFQDACREVIERYAGFIARYMGDGMLVYFGYPRAHEDDAERAVRTGLDIVRAMSALNEAVGRRHEVVLAVRIGLATGPVVVGDIVGQGAAEEAAVVGETPNLAARLQSVAEPNQVIIAAATRQLLGALFEYEDAGTHRLKGIEHPVTNSTLYPVIEHVKRAVGWTSGDSAEQKLDKLESALVRQSSPLDEAMPLFAALLSLPLPESRYAPLTLSARQQREQTLDALASWLLDEAEQIPVLSIWEDLHWADPTTLELLGIVVEQSPTVSMLNVLTYRPELMPPWSMHSHMTPITLNRLDRAEAQALVHQQAGGKRVPEIVVEHVVEKADGVPLYVEELTKTIRESGSLTEHAEEYVLKGSLISPAGSAAPSQASSRQLLDICETALTEAETFQRRTGEHWWETELHRLHGELSAATGELPEAESRLETALAVARDRGARSFELRAATSLARLWHRQGRRNEGRERLASIYESFSEGFDTADLHAANTTLESVS